MMEYNLMSYGGIGILALVMIVQNHKLQKRADKRETELAVVVRNNTIALTQVAEVLRRR